MEVEAEAAAAALQEEPRRSHGCMRPIIWCAPTMVFYVLLFGVGFALDTLYPGCPASVGMTVAGILIAGTVFGIGCFDGLLSSSTLVASPSERQKRIILHGLFFTAHQVWLVPAMSVLLMGACAALSSI